MSKSEPQHGSSPASFLRFVGCIPLDDLELMHEVIELDCEEILPEVSIELDQLGPRP